MLHRRSFLSSGLRAASAGCLAAPSSAWSPACSETLASERVDQDAAQWPVAIFTKVFQTHRDDQLAEAVAQIGADGVELPLRRGGHIEPKRIGDELPPLVEALAQRNKRVLIAASDIVAANEQAANYLKTLRDNGVTHYRMGYYRYGDDGSRLQQVRRFAAQAKELAALSAELGVVGLYQNHAGEHYLGSVIWDLAMLMEEIGSPALGVALDLRHLRVEVGVSWQAMIELIRPHCLSIFAKNAVWTGGPNPRIKDVPLDEGMADVAMFQSVWKGITRPAPLSVHVEHLGQQPLAPEATAEMIAASRHDVSVLRSWLQRSAGG